MNRNNVVIFSGFLFLIIAIFGGCFHSSDHVRDFLFPNRIGFIFKDENNKGYFGPYEQTKDGFDLTFGFIALDRSTHIEALYGRWVGEIVAKLPQHDSVNFTIKKCSIEITYNKAQQRVRNVLYLIDKSGSLYPRKLPSKIDSTLFASISESEEYHEFGSIENTPVEVLTSNEYGKLTVYLVFYDFPDGVDQIDYSINFKAKCGDKLFQIEKMFSLHKASFEAKTKFD